MFIWSVRPAFPTFPIFYRPPKQTHIDKVSKLLPVVGVVLPHVFAVAAGLLVSLLGVSVATLLAKATAKTRKARKVSITEAETTLT